MDGKGRQKVNNFHRFGVILIAAILLSSVKTSFSSLFHDMRYEELSDRSYSLASAFATTATAKDIYNLEEAHDVSHTL